MRDGRFNEDGVSEDWQATESVHERLPDGRFIRVGVAPAPPPMDARIECGMCHGWGHTERRCPERGDW